MVRTAESVQRDIWVDIAEHVGLLEDPVFPAAPVWSDHVSHAQAMRDFLDRESQKSVCGVCSRMCRDIDMDTHAMDALPNLALLDAAVPPTDAHPRDALTVYDHSDGVKYCIQPAACSVGLSGQVDVAVCESCFRHLKNGRVPPESLVCFDTGKYLGAL